MSDLVETELGPVPEKDLNKWNLVIHYMEPIMEFYKDRKVTEIMINRYDSIFVEGLDGKRKTNASFKSETQLERLINQISIALKQDEEKPAIIDARFPDQSRTCCTTKVVTPMGSTITMRCAPKTTLSLDDLIKYKSLNEEMKEYLRERVEKEDNTIISGSVNSGKTTLIRAFAEFIPKTQRILICEDTQELHLDFPDQIPMEAPKRRDSDIDLPLLIKTTLRQNPNRVFVGEIRDAAACDAFLQVINTGINGCVTSIHANSPKDAIRRIQYLLSKEGLIGFDLAGHEIKNSVHLLIQTERTINGKRITNISRLNEEKNVEQVFGYDEKQDQHYRL